MSSLGTGGNPCIGSGITDPSRPSQDQRDELFDPHPLLDVTLGKSLPPLVCEMES